MGTPRMAILYTQIIKLFDRRILSGEYSPQSSSLKPGNEIIKELRDVSGSIPKDGTTPFYTFNSVDTRFMFYFDIHGDLVCAVISDKYTSPQLASEYTKKVMKDFSKVYSKDTKTTYYAFDMSIKAISDKFNKDSSYMQGMMAVEETKSLLTESLNMIIKRDENINSLKGLANKMAVEAQMMQKNIQKMHFNGIVNDYWKYIVAFVLLVLFLYYITH